MKRIRLYIVSAILLTAGFTSCNEKFLEIDHTDIVTPEVLLTSQDYVVQGLNGLYDLFYPNKDASGPDSQENDMYQNWGLKPQLGFSNYPALDLQATGWDIPLNTHEWKPDFYMFGAAWKRCYRTIDRCNRFLANLENANVDIFDNGQKTKNTIEAEARAIRAFYYTFLCQNWGGVPMLLTGETYSNTPSKARGTEEEAWNIIIKDLEFARDNLDYTPWNGNIGRITKGMAKAYLGLAYMYNKRFADAKKELKDVIDCGQYELNPCFFNIHTPGQVWQKESVWEVAFPTWDYMNWGAESSTDAVIWWGKMFSAPDFGGWGPACVSYECCWSFEPGDKRLEYSVVQLGNLHPGFEQQLGEPGSAQIGMMDGSHDPFYGGDNVPNNYFIKFWKEYAYNAYTSMSLTYMRLAGVMLNYAECCFETNDMANGWKYVNAVRDRAWGKLEATAQPSDYLKLPYTNDPTIKAPDAETYYSHYKRTAGNDGGMVNVWKSWMKNSAGTDSIISSGGTSGLKVGLYQPEKVTLPYKYKPYTSPAWKVALVMERRHEFLGEYSFWQDICRMGVAKEFLDAEYPQNSIAQNANCIHTYRPTDFYDYMMLFPIPTLEMETNSALKPDDQNPGYK